MNRILIFKVIIVLTFFGTTLQKKGNCQSYELIGIIGKHLVKIDIITGQATDIGILDSTYVPYRQMTYDPFQDKVYAISNPGINPLLVSINPYTAAVQAIGPVDIIMPFQDIDRIESLAFNEFDSTLYAVGHEAPSSFFSFRIMAVDTATGGATHIANLSNTCQNDADGMVFYNGVGYILDGCPAPPVGFYSLNPNVGVASYIGTSTVVTNNNISVDPSSGIFYATHSVNRLLYTISPINASTVLIGTTHQSTDFDGELISALAFIPISPLAIEPSLSLIGEVQSNQVVKLFCSLLEPLQQGIYRIFRRIDKEDFELISTLESSSFNIEGQLEYIDHVVKSGWITYQVRFEDENGNKIFSNQVELYVEKSGIQIFPNPALDYLRWSPKDIKGIQAHIIDIQGRLIENRIVNNSQLDISFLPSGIYSLVLRSNKGILLARRIFVKE
ncbi:MAG: T9SS type A sorting domain-containing protein [Bacteroidetes bacterium]|nr:T9SS type A sorting domain-containing protein [Bacteroidota bacterium]